MDARVNGVPADPVGGVPLPRMTSDGYHTPPGRSPELACEKCACTTRQSPFSL
jgi:hypothetical protein